MAGKVKQERHDLTVRLAKADHSKFGIDLAFRIANVGIGNWRMRQSTAVAHHEAPVEGQSTFNATDCSNFHRSERLVRQSHSFHDALYGEGIVAIIASP